MSYARWSSDDFQSDVYTYADTMGGWTTWVAGRRHVMDRDTLPPEGMLDTADEESRLRWISRYREVMQRVSTAPMVDIDLPYAGERFNDDTPGECADRLEMLRGLGYHVPEDAIERLRDEDAHPEKRP
jgi:hypothetical protein